MDYQNLVGKSYVTKCYDQTGHTDTYVVTVKRITRGAVPMAIFDRPRGNGPITRSATMNAYADAVANFWKAF